MNARSIIKYQDHNYIICEFDHGTNMVRLLRYTQEVHDRISKGDINVLYEHNYTEELKYISLYELNKNAIVLFNY
jgi:hypothetical protein